MGWAGPLTTLTCCHSSVIIEGPILIKILEVYFALILNYAMPSQNGKIGHNKLMSSATKWSWKVDIFRLFMVLHWL